MVGCNGTNWENFRISAATRIIKRDIRLQVKFEARIVNRDVKNKSRINQESIKYFTLWKDLFEIEFIEYFLNIR